jgi:membrane protein required for colicin V production
LLFYGLVRGFFRGFFAELASLIAFIAAVYIAVHFSHFLGDYLAQKVTWNEQLVNILAFAITFVLIVFAISLAGKILTKIANLAALGILNKLLGAGFGLVKTAFIISVIIMFFTATQEDFNLIEEETLEQSVLYRPVKILAPIFIPSIVKEVKELEFLDE